MVHWREVVKVQNKTVNPEKLSQHSKCIITLYSTHYTKILDNNIKSVISNKLWFTFNISLLNIFTFLSYLFLCLSPRITIFIFINIISLHGTLKYNFPTPIINLHSSHTHHFPPPSHLTSFVFNISPFTTFTLQQNTYLLSLIIYLKSTKVQEI